MRFASFATAPCLMKVMAPENATFTGCGRDFVADNDFTPDGVTPTPLNEFDAEFVFSPADPSLKQIPFTCAASRLPAVRCNRAVRCKRAPTAQLYKRWRPCVLCGPLSSPPWAVTMPSPSRSYVPRPAARARTRRHWRACSTSSTWAPSSTQRRAPRRACKKLPPRTAQPPYPVQTGPSLCGRRAPPSSQVTSTPTATPSPRS